MLIINARAEVEETERFAEQDAVCEVAPTGEPVPIASGELLRRVAGGRVLVLVHGFNNTFEVVMQAYRFIHQTAQTHFSDAFDAVVGYSWPGGASGLDYFGAKARAAEAGRRLRRHLAALHAAGCTLDVAGHSMGVRVALAALKAPAPFAVRNVFALGAAVGVQPLEGALASGRQFYVFHTNRDAMLSRWYRLFEWETPLGYAGLDPAGELLRRHPNVTVVNCDDVVPSHTAYRFSKPFVGYLARELSAPQRGPFVRLTHDGPTDERPIEKRRPHGTPFALPASTTESVALC